MSYQYRWATSTATPWASMSASTLFDDGSAGDTATGESAGIEITLPAVSLCAVVAGNAHLVARIQHTTRQNATEWRCAGSLSVLSVNPQFSCMPDTENLGTEAGAATAILEGWDGAAWITIDSIGFTVPLRTLVGTPNTETFDFTRAIVANGYCDLRVHIPFNYTYVGTNNTITTTARLTDFRLTGTDTGIACGGDPDPGPLPIPAENCTYTEDAAAVCTYTEDAAAVCTYSEDAATVCTYTND